MLLNTVSLLELIHASAGIDELLPARKERMAFAANIHFQRLDVLRRTRFKGLAASADDRYFVIFGMNIRFHIRSPHSEILNVQNQLYPFSKLSSTDFESQTKKLPACAYFFKAADGKTAKIGFCDPNACKTHSLGV